MTHFDMNEQTVSPVAVTKQLPPPGAASQEQESGLMATVVCMGIVVCVEASEADVGAAVGLDNSTGTVVAQVPATSKAKTMAASIFALRDELLFKNPGTM
jgi:hypothetical protein